MTEQDNNLTRRKNALFGRNDSALRAEEKAVSTKAGLSLDSVYQANQTTEKQKIVPTDSLIHRFKSDSLKFLGTLGYTTPISDLVVHELIGKNNQRRSLFIQNLSRQQDIYLSFGNGKSLQGAVQIVAGSSISFDAGICPNNEIAVGAKANIGSVGSERDVEISILEGFVNGY